MASPLSLPVDGGPKPGSAARATGADASASAASAAMTAGFLRIAGAILFGPCAGTASAQKSLFRGS